MSEPTTKRLPWFWSALGVILFLDQATKYWITHNIPEHASEPPQALTVIENFFYIVHVWNDGAALNMFSGHGEWLALLALVALFALYYFRNDLQLHLTLNQFAFGMLAGGIMGNFIDRIAYGHVIDFIDIHLPGLRYPAFNIADSGITIGVALYFYIVFREWRQEKRKAQTQS